MVEVDGVCLLCVSGLVKLCRDDCKGPTLQHRILFFSYPFHVGMVAIVLYV